MGAHVKQAHFVRALRTPTGLSAAALLGVTLLLAIFAPVLWSARASAIDALHILQGPSPQHWLGTNGLGQDVFYRVLVASRLSVGLAVVATAIGVACGLALGTAPLIVGPRAGRLLTAMVNVAVAFPALLLALFFAVIFGVGARGALLAIGFALAPSFARLTRTLSASVAGLDYIAAARIAGVSRLRLLTRHVLPNIGETLIVNATIGAGDALLSFAGLSFLGLGVQAPSYDWGQLLTDGLQGIYTRPAAALAPGVAVVVAGLAFNLFGEALAAGLGVPSPRLGRPGPRTPAAEPATQDPKPAARTEAADPVLSVSGLHVEFPGAVRPVRGVSFTIGRGEAVGLVGESGSGKSLTALAVARLLEPPARVSAGRLSLLGQDLLGGDVRDGELRGGELRGGELRGGDVRGRDKRGAGLMTGRELRRFLGIHAGLVFQDPMTSFNPVKRVGSQLAEVAAEHHGLSRRDAAARAVDRLRAVRIPRPERRARQFPHELSGGMRQRAMIGMAVMGEPALVIADEPTTALDVTVQRQVLRLLKSIQASRAAALLFISHDITVVGQVCDRVLVMYAGRIVENLPAADLAAHARHPYTRALLAAVPSMETSRELPLAVISGRPADPGNPPGGCAFAPRCPFGDAKCREADPALVADEEGREVACWHTDRVAAAGAAGGVAGGVAAAPTADPESASALAADPESAGALSGGGEAS